MIDPSLNEAEPSWDNEALLNEFPLQPFTIQLDGFRMVVKHVGPYR
jgi:hypothetical protein